MITSHLYITKKYNTTECRSRETAAAATTDAAAA